MKGGNLGVWQLWGNPRLYGIVPQNSKFKKVKLKNKNRSRIVEPWDNSIYNSKRFSNCLSSTRTFEIKITKEKQSLSTM